MAQSANFFPSQSERVGESMEVPLRIEGRNESPVVKGEVIRDDADEPYTTMVLLETGDIAIGDEAKGFGLPEQASHLGKLARVVYYKSFSTFLGGTVVRSDSEYPFRTIIKLESGEFVDNSECEYKLSSE